MNFLAHILLSGNKEGVIMGNYVGDFVKGRLTPEKTSTWNADYVVGLKLHRYIDSFTDTHPDVQRAKKVAALSLGKLAGIAMDVYFDYFLAKHFNQHQNEQLETFSYAFYSTIEKNMHLVPEGMIPMMNSMVRQDWLTTYATIEGIELTFGRMSRRAEYLAPLAFAADDLRRNQDLYYKCFQQFYPQLQLAASVFLAEHTE